MSFQDESPDTQQMFRSAYGDQAESRWNWEHNGSQGTWSPSSGSSSNGHSYSDAVAKALDASNTYNKWAKQGDWANANKALAQSAKQAAADIKMRKAILEKDWYTARANARSQEEQNAIDKQYKESLVSLSWDEHSRLWGQLGLDRAKFAGDLLKQATEYQSQPSAYWKSLDYNAGIQNLMAGGAGAAFGNPVNGGGVTNDLGTFADSLGLRGLLAQAQGGGGPQGAGSWLGNLGETAAGSGAAATTGASTTQQSGAGGQADQQQTDLRSEALKAVIKNWTPSGTQGWDPRDIQALTMIGNIAQQGAHKLAPGSLESMDPDARDAFLAGIPRSGNGSTRDFASAYSLSRPAQGTSSAA